MIDLKGKKRRLVVVSNRLPFYRYKNEDDTIVCEKSTGGLITAMEPILIDTAGVWMGWDGLLTEDSKKTGPEIPVVPEIYPAPDLKRSYKVICVPLTEAEHHEYYNRFSNETLWSLFHYFFEKTLIDSAAWDAYCAINKRFAEYIDRLYTDADLIWIQDFHLFMTPFFLRSLRPRAEIHFFLHIPFPHIDIFSILPWQKELIASLLSCNSVGFHHRQYLKNFSSVVENYNRENKLTDKKNCLAYVNPISIDFDTVNRTSRMPEVRKKRDGLREKIMCPKFILGVDRIDYSKGIKERLLGLELLMEKHPELKKEFYYYQLLIPSRENVTAYINLKKEIDEIIGRINGKYSESLWSPVHYHYGVVPFDELVALYSAADIALVTPLRDGMNLVCKEYVAAHSDNDGILILSKFAGAIAEIKNCLPVNPYSIENIADVLFEAIHMPEKDRKKKMSRMRQNIKKNNIETWLRDCLKMFSLSEQEK
ncbi:MAG: trehalose-6-phosphate synthase [Candidatus Omnitrophota bacterium]